MTKKTFTVYLPIVVILALLYVCFIGIPKDVIAGLGEVRRIEVYQSVKTDSGVEQKLLKTIEDQQRLAMIAGKLHRVRTPVNSSNWTIKRYEARIHGESGERTLVFSEREIAGVGPMPHGLFTALVEP